MEGLNRGSKTYAFCCYINIPAERLYIPTMGKKPMDKSIANYFWTHDHLSEEKERVALRKEALYHGIV